MAAVRGIGVAVITSTSGTGSAAGLVAQRGPLLDAEAVLLVDDHRARATRNSTPSWMSAWVPMTRSTSPGRQAGEDAPPLGRRRPGW